MSVLSEGYTTDGWLIERLEDNGDGTGTLTYFDADGNEVGTEVVDLPEPEPTEAERIAATIDALLEALGGGQ